MMLPGERVLGLGRNRKILVEVSRCLVGLPAFKAGVTGVPRQAGSIPVHLRESRGY